MTERWSTGGSENSAGNDESREPSKDSRVQEGVRSFNVEELDRLARIFRLLDTWDRAQRSATKERKAA
jgi:hypothetical protein